jgi:hypothetical protein
LGGLGLGLLVLLLLLLELFLEDFSVFEFDCFHYLWIITKYLRKLLFRQSRKILIISFHSLKLLFDSILRWFWFIFYNLLLLYNLSFLQKLFIVFIPLFYILSFRN